MNSQPSSEEPTTELRMGQAIPWGVCLVLLVALVLLAAAGKLPLPWTTSTTDRQEAAFKKRAERNNEFGSVADRTHARLEWNRLSSQLESTETLASDALAKRESFADEIRSLETSDLGRRIAADQERVAQFEAIKDQGVPSQDSLQQMEQDAKEYLKLAKAALADETVIIGPSENVRTDASKMAEKAQETANRLSQLQRALSSLTEGAGAATADQTLEETLSQRKKRQSDSLLAQISQERERIRDDAQKRQLENERLTEQAVQNAEIERQEAQQRLRAADARASAAKEKQLVREAEEKIAAERAHAAKLRQFEQALPEIQSLLSPMISRGRMQLGSNGWTAGEDGPVSLTSLRRAKALELNERGLITLGSIFGGPLNRNDRPRGGFPESMTTNETTIRRAQELLVEFGDILVEKGLLQP